MNQNVPRSQINEDYLKHGQACRKIFDNAIEGNIIHSGEEMKRTYELAADSAAALKDETFANLERAIGKFRHIAARPKTGRVIN